MSVSTLRLGRAWAALPRAESRRASGGSSSGSVTSCQHQQSSFQATSGLAASLSACTGPARTLPILVEGRKAGVDQTSRDTTTASNIARPLHGCISIS